MSGRLAVVGDLQRHCACPANTGTVPGIVLDPFMGSGTTAIAAEALGRDWLGIEVNPDFAALAEERIVAARQKPAPTSSGARTLTTEDPTAAAA